MLKRILIITYYWPPSGGSGVLRWVKTAKYLHRLGYDPVIYTADNADYPATDNSIGYDLPKSMEVIKTPIWEPYTLYRKFTSKRKEEKFNQGGFISTSAGSPGKEKVALWIRSNLFIPDARRFWVKPSVRFLKKYLASNPVKAIITTGPPHSLHLIGMHLKRSLGIPWISDFRDPWTKIYYYPNLPLSAPANALHHKLEKKVLKRSDRVITVGKTIAKELESISQRKIEVVENGFDLEETPAIKPTNNKKFRIVHTGNISRNKNQHFLWKAISRLLYHYPELKNDLEIVQAGAIDHNELQFFKEINITSFITKYDYLPNNKVLELQQTASVLLLMISNTKYSKGILTGKLFEYLAASKPVLAIAPLDSDLASVINQCDAGTVVDFNNNDKAFQVLDNYYTQFKANMLTSNTKNHEKYSRLALTKRIVRLIEDL